MNKLEFIQIVYCQFRNRHLHKSLRAWDRCHFFVFAFVCQPALNSAHWSNNKFNHFFMMRFSRCLAVPSSNYSVFFLLLFVWFWLLFYDLLLFVCTQNAYSSFIVSPFQSPNLIRKLFLCVCYVSSFARVWFVQKQDFALKQVYCFTFVCKVALEKRPNWITGLDTKFSL